MGLLFPELTEPQQGFRLLESREVCWTRLLPHRNLVRTGSINMFGLIAVPAEELKVLRVVHAYDSVVPTQTSNPPAATAPSPQVSVSSTVDVVDRQEFCSVLPATGTLPPIVGKHFGFLSRSAVFLPCPKMLSVPGLPDVSFSLLSTSHTKRTSFACSLSTLATLSGARRVSKPSISSLPASLTHRNSSRRGDFPAASTKSFRSQLVILHGHIVSEFKPNDREG